MATAKELKADLTRWLTLADPGLIGCQRRNVWTGGTKPNLRGNSLLAMLGDKTTVETPVGPLEYYRHYDTILQFRGGPWQDHWADDFSVLWSVINTYGTIKLAPHIMLIQENQGELDVVEVPILERTRDVADALARAVIEGRKSNPPARIAKNTNRAFRTCTGCPHRTRCNAADLLAGATQDWSDSYRKELGK